MKNTFYIHLHSHFNCCLLPVAVCCLLHATVLETIIVYFANVQEKLEIIIFNLQLSKASQWIPLALEQILMEFSTKNFHASTPRLVNFTHRKLISITRKHVYQNAPWLILSLLVTRMYLEDSHGCDPSIVISSFVVSYFLFGTL